MKDRVEKYVDNLFGDIYETNELKELKEEVNSNLLEKTRDFLDQGYDEDETFNKAISDLGDMSELIHGLKRASEQKIYENMHRKQSIDKKHVIGYIVASVILLVGIMLSGVKYLDTEDLLYTVRLILPFLIISSGLFIYFGLTQETAHAYGMKNKRALGYSLATMILILGLALSGLSYLGGIRLSKILGTLMISVIPSSIIYIYLGLTEKNRNKVDWEKQWIAYYSNPKTMMIYGNLSGALWILVFGAIPLIGFKIGWKYAWIPFVVAISLQLVMEAVFATKKK